MVPSGLEICEVQPYYHRFHRWVKALSSLICILVNTCSFTWYGTSNITLFSAPVVPQLISNISNIVVWWMTNLKWLQLLEWGCSTGINWNLVLSANLDLTILARKDKFRTWYHDQGIRRQSVLGFDWFWHITILCHGLLSIKGMVIAAFRQKQHCRVWDIQSPYLKPTKTPCVGC